MENRTTAHSLAERLTAILLRLNQGEALSRSTLAAEFGVSERTLYRDLGRLAPLIQCRTDGRYQLDPGCAPRLFPRDLDNLLQLSGLERSLPAIRAEQLLSTLRAGSLEMRNDHCEPPAPASPNFGLLDTAIRQHQRCRCTYKDKPRLLEPYRLIHLRGIWYLSATEAGQLKSFALNRIHDLQADTGRFVPDPEIRAQISTDDDIWFSTHKFEVRLRADAVVADYFLRRPLLPAQRLLGTHPDGSLELHSLVADSRQILPLVRYWLPHLHILSPAALAAELRAGLRDYLDTHPPESPAP